MLVSYLPPIQSFLCQSLKILMSQRCGSFGRVRFLQEALPYFLPGRLIQVNVSEREVDPARDRFINRLHTISGKE